ncbi:hypothetical protein M9Y10_017172 [Tritrichomonas musculus]|uniref:AlgX/AlgJ SGNH hydrolase-like domain-containing protein n=1 Tax=Tritrichomonas musculus TaxID=1915356 RepID=A0ABR2HVP7_9EUKA
MSLFLILAFYYKLYFIQLNNNGISYYQVQKHVPRPKLFFNGSFVKNFSSSFWPFIIDNFIGSFLKVSIELTVFYKSNDRFLGNRVTKGRSGFYFYTNRGDGDNLKDFLKQNLVSPQQLEKAATKVKCIMDICSYLRIPFLLLTGPNKHSVYSEFFPFERPPGITRADQLSQIFQKINVTYIYPRDYLILLKKNNTFPFYYETDTHWNSLGAYYVSFLVIRKIKEFFPKISFPEINYSITAKLVRGNGDIIGMTPLIKRNNTWCTIVSVTPQNGPNITKIVNGRNFKTAVNDHSLPKALIFRDSFFTALEPFTSPLFSQAEYIWNKIDINYLKKVKPDLLIFEMVERYSPYYFS